jgi:hypothetical protein
MSGAFAVDRTLISDVERTRIARPDMISTHFDLQPAIAARGTASTGSLVLLVQMTKPAFDPGCSLNKIASARKLNPKLLVASR